MKKLIWEQKVDAYWTGYYTWQYKTIFSPPIDPVLFKLYCMGFDGLEIPNDLWYEI